MVARMWRGWCSVGDAEEIASRLRESALARYEAASGYMSGSVLVRPLAGGAELVTYTLWESAESVPQTSHEDHPLLVARQTIPDVWEVAEAAHVVARAA